MAYREETSGVSAQALVVSPGAEPDSFLSLSSKGVTAASLGESTKYDPSALLERSAGHGTPAIRSVAGGAGYDRSPPGSPRTGTPTALARPRPYSGGLNNLETRTRTDGTRSGDTFGSSAQSEAPRTAGERGRRQDVRTASSSLSSRRGEPPWATSEKQPATAESNWLPPADRRRLSSTSSGGDGEVVERLQATDDSKWLPQPDRGSSSAVSSFNARLTADQQQQAAAAAPVTSSGRFDGQRASSSGTLSSGVSHEAADNQLATADSDLRAQAQRSSSIVSSRTAQDVADHLQSASLLLQRDDGWRGALSSGLVSSRDERQVAEQALSTRSDETAMRRPSTPRAGGVLQLRNASAAGPESAAASSVADADRWESHRRVASARGGKGTGGDADIIVAADSGGSRMAATFAPASAQSNNRAAYETEERAPAESFRREDRGASADLETGNVDSSDETGLKPSLDVDQSYADRLMRAQPARESDGRARQQQRVYEQQAAAGWPSSSDELRRGDERFSQTFTLPFAAAYGDAEAGRRSTGYASESSGRPRSLFIQDGAGRSGQGTSAGMEGAASAAAPAAGFSAAGSASAESFAPAVFVERDYSGESMVSARAVRASEATQSRRLRDDASIAGMSLLSSSIDDRWYGASAAAAGSSAPSGGDYPASLAKTASASQPNKSAASVAATSLYVSGGARSARYGQLARDQSDGGSGPATSAVPGEDSARAYSGRPGAVRAATSPERSIESRRPWARQLDASIEGDSETRDSSSSLTGQKPQQSASTMAEAASSGGVPAAVSNRMIPGETRYRAALSASVARDYPSDLQGSLVATSTLSANAAVTSAPPSTAARSRTRVDAAQGGSQYKSLAASRRPETGSDRSPGASARDQSAKAMSEPGSQQATEELRFGSAGQSQESAAAPSSFRLLPSYMSDFVGNAKTSEASLRGGAAFEQRTTAMSRQSLNENASGLAAAAAASAAGGAGYFSVATSQQYGAPSLGERLYVVDGDYARQYGSYGAASSPRSGASGRSGNSGRLLEQYSRRGKGEAAAGQTAIIQSLQASSGVATMPMSARDRGVDAASRSATADFAYGAARPAVSILQQPTSYAGEQATYLSATAPAAGRNASAAALSSRMSGAGAAVGSNLPPSADASRGASDMLSLQSAASAGADPRAVGRVVVNLSAMPSPSRGSGRSTTTFVRAAGASGQASAPDHSFRDADEPRRSLVGPGTRADGSWSAGAKSTVSVAYGDEGVGSEFRPVSDRQNQGVSAASRFATSGTRSPMAKNASDASSWGAQAPPAVSRQALPPESKYRSEGVEASLSSTMSRRGYVDAGADQPMARTAAPRTQLSPRTSPAGQSQERLLYNDTTEQRHDADQRLLYERRTPSDAETPTRDAQLAERRDSENGTATPTRWQPQEQRQQQQWQQRQQQQQWQLQQQRRQPWDAGGSRDSDLEATTTLTASYPLTSYSYNRRPVPPAPAPSAMPPGRYDWRLVPELASQLVQTSGLFYARPPSDLRTVSVGSRLYDPSTADVGPPLIKEVAVRRDRGIPAPASWLVAPAEVSQSWRARDATRAAAADEASFDVGDPGPTRERTLRAPSYATDVGRPPSRPVLGYGERQQQQQQQPAKYAGARTRGSSAAVSAAAAEEALTRRELTPSAVPGRLSSEGGGSLSTSEPGFATRSEASSYYPQEVVGYWPMKPTEMASFGGSAVSRSTVGGGGGRTLLARAASAQVTSARASERASTLMAGGGGETYERAASAARSVASVRSPPLYASAGIGGAEPSFGVSGIQSAAAFQQREEIPRLSDVEIAEGQASATSMHGRSVVDHERELPLAASVAASAVPLSISPAAQQQRRLTSARSQQLGPPTPAAVSATSQQPRAYREASYAQTPWSDSSKASSSAAATGRQLVPAQYVATGMSDVLLRPSSEWSRSRTGAGAEPDADWGTAYDLQTAGEAYSNRTFEIVGSGVDGYSGYSASSVGRRQAARPTTVDASAALAASSRTTAVQQPQPSPSTRSRVLLASTGASRNAAPSSRHRVGETSGDPANELSGRYESVDDGVFPLPGGARSQAQQYSSAFALSDLNGDDRGVQRWPGALEGPWIGEFVGSADDGWRAADPAERSSAYGDSRVAAQRDAFGYARSPTATRPSANRSSVGVDPTELTRTPDEADTPRRMLSGGAQPTFDALTAESVSRWQQAVGTSFFEAQEIPPYGGADVEASAGSASGGSRQTVRPPIALTTPGGSRQFVAESPAAEASRSPIRSDRQAAGTAPQAPDQAAIGTSGAETDGVAARVVVTKWTPAVVANESVGSGLGVQYNAAYLSDSVPAMSTKSLQPDSEVSDWLNYSEQSLWSSQGWSAPSNMPMIREQPNSDRRAPSPTQRREPERGRLLRRAASREEQSGTGFGASSPPPSRAALVSNAGSRGDVPGAMPRNNNRRNTSTAGTLDTDNGYGKSNNRRNTSAISSLEGEYPWGKSNNRRNTSAMTATTASPDQQGSEENESDDMVSPEFLGTEVPEPELFDGDALEPEVNELVEPGAIDGEALDPDFPAPPEAEGATEETWIDPETGNAIDPASEELTPGGETSERISWRVGDASWADPYQQDDTGTEETERVPQATLLISRKRFTRPVRFANQTYARTDRSLTPSAMSGASQSEELSSQVTDYTDATTSAGAASLSMETSRYESTAGQQKSGRVDGTLPGILMIGFPLMSALALMLVWRQRSLVPTNGFRALLDTFDCFFNFLLSRS